ncbi:hypothetical protein C2R22_05045 [Salinigranum rubrum]|uniref:SRCR domain-containing protein n=2 Tax=Salinigranum rubrum TaxID=755307 RepID=A0A2I8VGU0_9EURY|nr:hypothetical protein C2R22_05045 [Salinigranum rubrum]
MLRSASPELRVVAAAAGTHARERSGTIESLVGSVSDWEALCDIAWTHSVEPHLHRLLVSGDDVSVPSWVRDRLDDDHRAAVRERLYLATELARIVEAFERAAVPIVPFKGPALAQMAYGDVTARQYGDLDFVVRRADLPAVVETFETMGYALERNWSMSVEEIRDDTSVIRPPSEFSFHRASDGTSVEVRWLFGSKHRPVDYGFESLWARRHPVSLFGETVRTLSPEDSLVALVRHGAKHAWGRLGWVSDVARLVHSCAVDWGVTLDRARDAGAERDLLLGLRLVAELTDVEVPASLLGRARASRRVDWLCGRIERRLAANPAMPCYEVSVHERFLFDLLLCTDASTLARMSLGLAFRPTEGDYEWRPLPDDSTRCTTCPGRSASPPTWDANSAAGRRTARRGDDVLPDGEVGPFTPLPSLARSIAMVSESTYATVAALLVTSSLPFYLYGAKIMIDAETVTWNVLVHHLSYIFPGLVLNTVPVVTWMIPRLLQQLNGLSALHAILGLQAYAMLVFALTGIVRIFQAKHQANLYRDPDPDVDLDELHENMSAWRGRLRVGVFGYVLFWFGAWLLGLYRFATGYVLGSGL